MLEGDIHAFVARTGYTGEDGFELFVAADEAVAVWRLALAVGGAAITPCGLSSRDTLRLEAGMPLYGQELTRETTPFDAGLGRVVAFGTEANPRGDFVGRAALEAARDAQPDARARRAGWRWPALPARRLRGHRRRRSRHRRGHIRRSLPDARAAHRDGLCRAGLEPGREPRC